VTRFWPSRSAARRLLGLATAERDGKEITLRSHPASVACGAFSYKQKRKVCPKSDPSSSVAKLGLINSYHSHLIATARDGQIDKISVEKGSPRTGSYSDTLLYGIMLRINLQKYVQKTFTA